jgi:hypothetical protein
MMVAYMIGHPSTVVYLLIYYRSLYKGYCMIRFQLHNLFPGLAGLVQARVARKIFITGT